MTNNELVVDNVSYEKAVFRINEHGDDYAYMNAYRYNGKHFRDEQGTIHTITFTRKEIVQCLVEKIEHATVRMTSLDIFKDADSYRLYNEQLNEYKQALYDMI